MKKIIDKETSPLVHFLRTGFRSSIIFPQFWKRLEKGILFVSFLSIFLLASGGSGCSSLFAQQLPFSSQYYTDQFVINPAFTGFNENINAFVTHRSQWTGLAGAPQTSYFTIDGPIQAKNSSLGLKIYSDVTDIIGRTGAFASYSYKYKISDSSSLSFGIACGVLANKIDFSKALIRDKDDPFLSEQLQNKTVFSADLGIVYQLKRLQIGFAVPQVLGNRIKYPIFNGDNSYYNMDPHYQGTVKYVFDLSKEKEITAYPLIMFRAVKGAPFQYDINAVVDWKRTGWLGIMYHSTYALAISGGVRYRNFSLGYAYDIGVSKIRSYTGSSSEFLLGYTLGEHKKGLNRFANTETPNADTSQVLTPNAKPDTTNQALFAQLKAMSDTNRAEINRLKAELAKAKGANLNAPVDNGPPVDLKSAAFISSRLLDEKGNPLNDAQIEVVDKNTNEVIAKHLVTNDGYSRIPVPKGKTYNIVFSKPGYLFKPVNVVIPDSAGYEKDLKDITLQKLEAGKKIVLNNISFDLNQSTLRKESFSELDNCVKLMNDIPSLEIEISGHTDNLGSTKSNQILSENRAKAVMDYLISKGCDKNRLTYKGYGSTQPIASNDTEEGRQLNRRTEFKVLKVGSEYTVVTGVSPSNTENYTGNIMPSASNPEKDAMLIQLKAKSESYQAQIDHLNSELAKIKMSGTTPSNTGKLIDSLHAVYSAETNALRLQLKAKSDTNQLQIDRLKSDLAKAKSAETAVADIKGLNDRLTVSGLSKETEDLRAQLKAKSDTNQMQIDQLKAELEKAKMAGTKTPANTENEALISRLKVKSDTNQAQIDQLKSELAKAKDSEKEIANQRRVNDSLLHNFLIGETDAMLTELKAKSDTNLAQIERLKAELANAKNSETKSPTNDENNILLAKLYVKSDTNQAQIDRLKAELANAKIAAAKIPVNTENEALIAQLKVKSDTNQAQIDQLKSELATAKIAVAKTPANTENEALIAKLKVKSDTNQAQIDQLKLELANAKNSEIEIASQRKVNDSLLHHFLIGETDAMLTELKTKSDTNQLQIDRLKSELEKSKTEGIKAPSTAENDALIAQLKIKSDTNQAQIDRLKAELANAKNSETKSPTNDENNILLTKLYVKSDTNQAQIDRLKAELANAKIAGTKAPSTTENDALIAQLKIKSDTNQAQIDRLKAELANAKTAGTKAPSTTENDALIAQLKIKSDTNQAQIDRLKAELAKTKETILSATNASNSKNNTSSAENEALRAQLKAKSDADQAEINRLKSEHEKTKSAETIPPTPTAATAGVRTFKTSDFVDENGKPVSTGFYVVIGAFGNKENAERFKAANIIKGHANTKMVQNQVTKIFNIFVLKTNNKEDADAEREKYRMEYPSVWILKLE